MTTRVRITLAEWAAQCEEWDAIAKELIAKAGPEGVTAFEVSEEQRRRADARGGVKLLDINEIELVKDPD